MAIITMNNLHHLGFFSLVSKIIRIFVEMFLKSAKSLDYF